MKLRLATDQKEKLIHALGRAGTSEIGGQLFGELLAPSMFRVTELTVQSKSGTFARFVVDLVDAGRAAMAFFRRTEHDYTRHNYIGEWHSHPSFAIQPSSTDARTMRELVRDYDFKGSFAVLMIVRLDDRDLRCGAWCFDRTGTELVVELEVEE